ncbi:hypothetical protein ACNKHL_03840 [Shigella flexneri]
MKLELFSRLYGRVRAVCAPGAGRPFGDFAADRRAYRQPVLQIVRFIDYRTRCNENRIKLVPIARTTSLYDRNVIPLALTRTIYQIEMMQRKSITAAKRWTLCAASLI